MPATPAWLAAVEALLNRGIQASPHALDLARGLDATRLRVDVRGLTSITASVSAGKLALEAAGGAHAAADATIAGSAPALLRLALGQRVPGPKSAADRPSVSGDAEVAGTYQRLIAAARPDAEEELSRLMGDFAARSVVTVAKRAVGWAQSVRRTAGENIAEYLQEESRDLVNLTELEEFLNGVDVAREAADRIGARVARLEIRRKGRA